MVMPGGLTGLQLAEQLIEKKPDLPVVITSGYSVEDISEKLSGSPNIRFVQKPYSPTSLAQAIRTGLDHPKKLTSPKLPTIR
jgi:FixJ family two-component response regulator